MSHDQRIPIKVTPGVVMDVKVGHSLMIGNVRVTLEKKSGQLARLRVVTSEDILIARPPLEMAL